MRHIHILRVLLGAVPLVASLALVPAGANAQAIDAGDQRSATTATAPAAGRAGKAVASEPVCSPSPGAVTCLAELRTDIPATANSSSDSTNPPGYHPRDIQSAYRLPVHAGAGRTVAVVSAFDNPNAESDLAVYRRTFHLPPCTTANGCFRKINQNGGSTPPPLTNPAWATETALDIEAVSATCPRCKILLVEADTNSLSNMLTAVAQARTQGAKFISMSWGLPENASQPALDQTYFNFPGIAFVGASGNGGYSGFIYRRFPVRHRCRGHPPGPLAPAGAGPAEEAFRLVRERMEPLRLRLLPVPAQAALPDRPRLPHAHRRRRLRARRSGHRLRLLLHVQCPGLEGDRRHQRVQRADRRHVRAGGEAGPGGPPELLPVRPPLGVLGHRPGIHGLMRRLLPLHRPDRLRRPDRCRHPPEESAACAADPRPRTVTTTAPATTSAGAGPDNKPGPGL